MPIMVNVGNSYKEVTAILDKNGNAIDTVYAQNGSPVYSAWKSMTLTGVPPLQFKANGTPLTAWSIYGNGQQTGTPAPDAPIQPEFVGVRTAQLFDKSNATAYDCYVASNGQWATGAGNKTVRISCDSNTQYTLSTASTYSAFRIMETSSDNIPSDGSPVSGTLIYYGSGNTYTFTTSNTAKYIIFQANSASLSQWLSELMLNTGTTALPYEPYGWAEKITCAGQTVPVYLGQTQTVRRIKKVVLDGSENWSYDSINTRFSSPLLGMDYKGPRATTFVCSHYEVIDDGRTIGNVPNNTAYAGGSVANPLCYIKTNEYSNEVDFKAYLAAQYAAGTPVTVWYVLATPTTGIVNEPLAKIGDYADELHSADAGIIIPTAKGANVLTVDTDLQPSTVSITGLIRPAQT